MSLPMLAGKSGFYLELEMEIRVLVRGRAVGILRVLTLDSHCIREFSAVMCPTLHATRRRTVNVQGIVLSRLPPLAQACQVPSTAAAPTTRLDRDVVTSIPGGR
jgi:hypothetical protein